MVKIKQEQLEWQQDLKIEGDLAVDECPNVASSYMERDCNRVMAILKQLIKNSRKEL